MGYYSDFMGEFKLSRKPRGAIRAAIKMQVEQAFGKYAVGQDNKNYTGSAFYNPDKHTVEPIATNMKGYSFPTDVNTIAAILRGFGISLKGEVYRHGQECDDHERYFFKKGKLFRAIGVISYTRSRPVV